MPEPRVTVIIPTYNWSTVLPFSIASVLEQSFTDFELLVIGDGCTDDSEAVVTSIADPRVRWLNLPRSGHQSGPNNEGLRQARGSLIAYLGHDDLWLPHHLRLHVAAQEDGADFAVSLAAIVGPEDSFIETAKPDLSRRRWLPPSSFSHRPSPACRWRDYREVTVTPEQDLLDRVIRSGARVDILPRLTAVKFPASLRRDVYRARPAHEQARWLRRIRSEPDVEAAILGLIVASGSRQVDGKLQKAWRLLHEPSQWWSFLWRRGGARIRARQHFKGVDHAGRSEKGRSADHERLADDRTRD